MILGPGRYSHQVDLSDIWKNLEHSRYEAGSSIDVLISQNWTQNWILYIYLFNIGIRFRVKRWAYKNLPVRKREVNVKMAQWPRIPVMVCN